MAENTKSRNGNGTHATPRDDAALVDGTSPLAYRRIVLATHDLVTDQYSVTLLIDGKEALMRRAESWSAAQEEALRLLTGNGEQGNGDATP
jgi:hypothetical protein